MAGRKIPAAVSAVTYPETELEPGTVSIEVAQAMRADQGDHECEVWAEGAEGAHEWNACIKYPGHDKFIPAPEFSIHHLPWPHQDEDVFECLQVIAQLTVRLRVQYVSKERPDGYTFSKYRGRRLTHTGSGMISELLSSEIAVISDDDEEEECDDDEDENDEKEEHEEVDDKNEQEEDNDTVQLEGICRKENDYVLKDNQAEDEEDCDEEEESDYDKSSDFGMSLDNKPDGEQGSCPCPECEKSPTPAQTWWRLHVFTATHVVYDNHEAEKTKVDVFFDDMKSVGCMKTMYGIAVHGNSLNEDGCYVECITHDKSLYDKLHSLCKHLSMLETKLFGKKAGKPHPPLCVIVSHPHGCAKQVTVGEWTERIVIGQKLGGTNYTEYRYTTCTCKGSSGAPVFLLGKGIGRDKYKSYPVHFHSSGTDDGLNRSGEWLDP